MKNLNFKLIIFSVCVLLILACTFTVATEEDIKVEKEGSSSSTAAQSTEASSNTPLNAATTGQSPTPKKKKSIWKKLMKELKHYKDDWFGNDHWYDRRSISKPKRTDFYGDFFSNFDDSFASMRRRMNNLMRRSNMLPSLFDDHQWWEDYTNTFNSMNKKESLESSSQSSNQPIAEMKPRGPISSVIRTINQDGKNELSIDINNIPKDVFDKKDIQVNIKENSLGDLITISGEKKTENGHFQFSKSFRFPKGSLDLDRVKASLSDEGTLSVKIQRIDEPIVKERVKQISIE